MATTGPAKLLPHSVVTNRLRFRIPRAVPGKYAAGPANATATRAAKATIAQTRYCQTAALSGGRSPAIVGFAAIVRFAVFLVGLDGGQSVSKSKPAACQVPNSANGSGVTS